ncbi:hypothetical protein ABW19_dt0202595 [Dactylella cylindrospora]|nr:hypothetical protein ABW19_dt0202595 [Dactylella cylindrospora]
MVYVRLPHSPHPFYLQSGSTLGYQPATNSNYPSGATSRPARDGITRRSKSPPVIISSTGLPIDPGSYGPNIYKKRSEEFQHMSQDQYLQFLIAQLPELPPRGEPHRRQFYPALPPEQTPVPDYTFPKPSNQLPEGAFQTRTGYGSDPYYRVNIGAVDRIGKPKRSFACRRILR